jgi:hypothetical protein
MTKQSQKRAFDKYRKSHPEKIREHQKKYVNKNREKISEYQRLRYHARKTERIDRCGRDPSDIVGIEKLVSEAIEDIRRRILRAEAKESVEPKVPIVRSAEQVEKDRAYGKAYRARNKSHIKERKHRSYIANPEKQKKQSREWYAANKDAAKERDKIYRVVNFEQLDAARKRYYREVHKPRMQALGKMRTTPPVWTDKNQVKVRNAVSHRIFISFKYFLDRGSAPRGSKIKYLGCTAAQLKSFLELKFQPGMSWENYGKRGWHIDHIKPISKFDISTEEGRMEAFNYQNLQPLWAFDNFSKCAWRYPEYTQLLLLI